MLTALSTALLHVAAFAQEAKNTMTSAEPRSALEVNLEPRQGQVIPAKDIIDEFNSVMRWISAPNVRVEVKSTAEFSF
jgi:hypothetical protein